MPQKYKNGNFCKNKINKRGVFINEMAVFINERNLYKQKKLPKKRAASLC